MPLHDLLPRPGTAGLLPCLPPAAASAGQEEARGWAGGLQGGRAEGGRPGERQAALRCPSLHRSELPGLPGQGEERQGQQAHTGVISR